jgi:malto-oligosyltrehalose trehalohydrolase
MPFGTEVRDDGCVHFPLWAPGATEVDLCLEQEAPERILPMVSGPDGWFGLTTEQAGPGSHYRFRIDGGIRVPDPASRFQPQDVHGPSEVVDPLHWHWTDANWRGRPWEQTVIYELHVGAFSPEGRFTAVIKRLDYLADLGVTAIELMPVADFPGARNWGYDGVLPFAPDSSYGRPEDLKALIQAAHGKGIMVFLDVVYNHFGPDGNYLHIYAPQFFNARHHTPWGAAINFDEPGSDAVRQFFIHNALYWLEEYHVDGLRLDAVDTIIDDSSPDILEELAAAVHQGPGQERHVHLVLENDNNAARYLRRDKNGRAQRYVAQWNDDFHHAFHNLLTGESEGCYADYDDRPVWYLGRCLAQGFGYQGETSIYRNGALRGEPSQALPPTAFVSFLQNHDQMGNRPFGERIDTLSELEPLRAAVALLLLAPPPPLLFMGEEFAARQPFCFFCHFDPELAAAVSAGRRRGFARFKSFADLIQRAPPPEPNDPATFQLSRLDWDSLSQAPHSSWLRIYRDLLTLRHREIVPRLAGMQGNAGEVRQLGERGLRVEWRLGEGSTLTLLANLGDAPLPITAAELSSGTLLYVDPDDAWDPDSKPDRLPSWCVSWFLRKA